jgi:hypothetical protein
MLAVFSSTSEYLSLQLKIMEKLWKGPIYHTHGEATTPILFRLSPMGDPFGNPNPKWVSNTISIAFNRVPIQKTHFGYQERHNPNLGILSL